MNGTCHRLKMKTEELAGRRAGIPGERFPRGTAVRESSANWRFHRVFKADADKYLEVIWRNHSGGRS